MAKTPTLRRRTARGLAIVALTATLGGILAAPAAAAHSKYYWTKTQCLAAQRAYASSFTAITKSCYWINPCTDGVCTDTMMYRFDYVTRY